MAVAKEPEKIWGPLVIAAVMPVPYKTLTAIEDATGFAFSTIHDWSKGNSNPKLDQLEVIARKTGIPVPDMLRGAPVGVPRAPRLREHPDWPKALAAAREQYGKRLPAYAFELAGDTSGPLPERLDAALVCDAAEFWIRHAPDAEIARAETAAAADEMVSDAKERAKRRGA